MTCFPSGVKTGKKSGVFDWVRFSERPLKSLIQMSGFPDLLETKTHFLESGEMEG